MKAEVLNINSPVNRHIMDACHLLRDYAELLQRVEGNKRAGMGDSEAVDRAIAACISDCDKPMASWLESHRLEATDMILTEYDEKKHLESVRKYGEEIGEARGEKRGEARGESKGVIQSYAELVQDGSITIEKAVQKTARLGVKSAEDFRKRAKLLGIDL